MEAFAGTENTNTCKSHPQDLLRQVTSKSVSKNDLNARLVWQIDWKKKMLQKPAIHFFGVQIFLRNLIKATL